MATYIPGVTDSGFNPVQYSPNLPYLANALQKATARYEKNYADIAQGYSSILNAPILNDKKRGDRDQYLAQIKDQLKTISTTDLSIQANVDQAESLYSPFWEDKEMLAHITDTKARQSQLREQERIAREHPDYDNSTPVAVMNYYMNKIKTSDDPNIINSTPLINAVGLKNNPKEFVEWLKKNDYKQEYSLAQNGYIYTQINGDGSLKSYDELYRTYLGNSAQDQYNMYGEYYKIQGIQEIKANEKRITGIDISDEEAIQRLPDFYVNKQMEDYENRKKTLTADLTLAKENAKKFENDIIRYEEFIRKGQDIIQSINDIDKEYNILKNKGGTNEEDVKKYNDLRKSISINPTGFFANYSYNKDVVTASRAAASNQSLKIQQDQAALAFAKAQQDAYQFNQLLDLKRREDARQETELQLKVEGADLTNVEGIAARSGKARRNAEGKVVAYENIVPTIQPGQSNVKIEDVVLTFENTIANLSGRGQAEMLEAFQNSNSSIIRNILSGPEVVTIAKAFQTNTYGEDYKSVRDKVKNNLKTAGVSDEVIKNIKDPVGLFGAILDYHKNATFALLTKRDAIVAEGKAPDQQLLTDISSAWSDYVSLNNASGKLQNAYALKKQFDESVNQRITKNPEKYKDISIKKKDGTYGLLTAQSLVDNFERVDKNNNKVKMSYDMMNAYINGTLDVKPVLSKNNEPIFNEFGVDVDYLKEYERKYGHAPYTAIDPATGIKHEIGDIIKRYGKPEVLKKNLTAGLQKFKSDIPSNLQQAMQEQTGKMGRSIVYSSDPSKREDYADVLATQFFSNINSNVVIEDDEYKIINSDKNLAKNLQKIVRNIISDPASGLTGVSFNPIGIPDPSKRNITLTYSKADVLKLIDKNKRSDYADWDGTLTFEIRDDANVVGFPTAEADAFYNLLLTNGSVKQSVEEEKFGLKYDFYRDQNNQIKFRAGYKKVFQDEQTGKLTYIWNNYNGNGIYTDNGGYETLPGFVTIDDFLNSLKSGMMKQMSQNDLATQKASAQQPTLDYSTKSKKEELDKMFLNVFNGTNK